MEMKKEKKYYHHIEKVPAQSCYYFGMKYTKRNQSQWLYQAKWSEY